MGSKEDTLNKALEETMEELTETDGLIPESTVAESDTAWNVKTREHDHGFSVTWNGTDEDIEEAQESFKHQYLECRCPGPAA
jgi:hypothetical protein